MSEWQDIETAPKDGTRFRGRQRRVNRLTGKMYYWRRITWYGKTSHVPLYGWCCGQGENVDLWQPTHWMPLPEPPK